MVTIHREGGLRTKIDKDNHEPAHIHVSGDGEAKANLIGADGRPALVWSVGMSKGDLRIAAERQAAFLSRWRDIHA